MEVQVWFRVEVHHWYHQIAELEGSLWRAESWALSQEAFTKSGVPSPGYLLGGKPWDSATVRGNRKTEARREELMQ